MAPDSGAKDINIFNDSQLVVNQANGSFQTKDSQLTTYIGYVKTMLGKFQFHNITQIPQAEKARVDSLTRVATTQPHQHREDTRIEILDKPSTTKTLAKIFHIETCPSWMDEIMTYKKDGTLLEDKLITQTLFRRPLDTTL